MINDESFVFLVTRFRGLLLQSTINKKEDMICTLYIYVCVGGGICLP